jgi:hypothetical protein
MNLQDIEVVESITFGKNADKSNSKPPKKIRKKSHTDSTKLEATIELATEERSSRKAKDDALETFRLIKEFNGSKRKAKSKEARKKHSNKQSDKKKLTLDNNLKF